MEIVFYHMYYYNVLFDHLMLNHHKFLFRLFVHLNTNSDLNYNFQNLSHSHSSMCIVLEM